MSLRDRINKFLNRDMTTIPNFVNSGFSHYTAIPRMDMTDALKRWSFVCMNKRANAFASVENYVTDLNDKRTDNNWIYDIIKKPNPLYSYQTLKRLAQMWLDLYGNAYINVQKSSSGQPINLWVLQSRLVFVNYDRNTSEFIYDYNTPQGVYHYKADEIIHIKRLFPSYKYEENYYMGSPGNLIAAIDSIGIDKSMIKYVQDFFLSDAVPPLVFKSQNEVGKDSAKSLKAEFSQSFPNNPVRGILQNGLEVEPLIKTADTFKGLISNELEGNVIKRIAAAFEIPLGLLDSSSFQNKSNADIVYNDFRNNVIEPICSEFESDLTSYFNQFDSNIKITHDKYKYIDIESDLKINDFLLKYGVATRNEVREIYGYEVMTDGDVPLLPSNVTTFEKLNAPMPEPFKEPNVPTNTDAIENTNKSLIDYESKDIIELKKKAYWNSYNEAMIRQESKVKPVLIKSFEAIKKECLNNLNKEELFNVKKFSDGLNTSMVNLYKPYVKEIYNKASGEIKNKSYIRKDNTQFEQEIIDAVVESTDKIRDSINTIDSELKDKVKQVIEENPTATKEELTNLLKEMVNYQFDEVLTQSRVDNIAETTTTYATNESQIIAWKDNKFKYTWLSRRDGKVRSGHLAADGQKPDKQGMFAVGGETMKHPAAGSIASNNCRCRCVLMSY